MNEVRIGVIGCGSIAHVHMQYFKEIPRLRFTAACDTSPASIAKVTEQYGVKGFASAEELLDSGLVDAVIISTPHFTHPPLSMAAMRRGIHVMTEKPVSVTAAAAAEVNEFHKKYPKIVYSAMFMLRADPKWKKVKSVLSSGAIGRIKRVHWTATNWLRTQAYYNSSSWRATWKGEGGGVLINQCPHNLDMLCWLVGTPTRVSAKIALGKYHKIEVEDEVTAMFDLPDGGTGVFIASTGEAPGTSYLEIVGDHGRLVITPGPSFTFDHFDQSVAEFISTSPSTVDNPIGTKSTIEIQGKGGHKLLTENFVRAILDGETLIAPGEEGLHSIELANAMIMSGITNKSIDIPMDRQGYEALLADLIAQNAK